MIGEGVSANFFPQISDQKVHLSRLIYAGDGIVGSLHAGNVQLDVLANHQS